MIFNIDPIAKPRMSRSDRWKGRGVVKRYLAYKDELNLKADLEGFKLSDEFSVVFCLPMPPSWSKRRKEKMINEPHRQKPDIDNLLKGLMDALLEKDETVHSVSAKKYWGTEGFIAVDLED